MLTGVNDEVYQSLQFCEPEQFDFWIPLIAG